MSKVIMSLMFYFFTFVTNVSATTRRSSRSAPCPLGCTCEQVEGRLTADCSNANLSSLSGPLPQGVMSLKMDDNALIDILNEENYFVKKGASDLLELSLKNCGLEKMSAGLLWGMRNLHKLSLSRNKIAEIPLYEKSEEADEIKGLFHDMASLRVLDLSHNRLSQLTSYTLKGTPELRELDLSYNRLATILDNAFMDTPRLTRINLQANHFYRIFPQPFFKLFNLKILNLWDNPYVCDCDLREFVKWQSDKYISEPPLCDSPAKLEGKRWDQLRLNEFACPPEMQPKEIRPHVVELGQTVQLSCIVKGDPEPHVTWQFYNSIVGGHQVYLSPQMNKIKIQDYFVNTPYSRRHNLTVMNISKSDVGVYHCRAKNFAGEDYIVFHVELAKAVEQVQSVNRTFLIPLQAGNNDLIFISLTAAAGSMLTIVLIMSVHFYRRSRRRSGARNNGTSGGRNGSVPCMSPRGVKPKTANGYGYHAVADEPTFFKEQRTNDEKVKNYNVDDQNDDYDEDGFLSCRDESTRTVLETVQIRKRTLSDQSKKPFSKLRTEDIPTTSNASMTTPFAPERYAISASNADTYLDNPYERNATTAAHSMLDLDCGSKHGYTQTESERPNLSYGFSTLPANYHSDGFPEFRYPSNQATEKQSRSRMENKFLTVSNSVALKDGFSDKRSSLGEELLAPLSYGDNDEELRTMLRETAL